MSAQLYAPSRRPAQEMQQRNTLLLHESFFSLKGVQDRPVSVATEFMESDFEEDDILSDDESVDNGGNNSPRGSMNSSGQPSFTTISSYDEVPTPRSSRMPMDLPVPMDPAKSVEGPRGPHLFRISTLSAEFQNALTLSPLTPKAPSNAAMAFHLQQSHHNVPLPHGITPMPPTRQQQAQAQSGPFRFSHVELDTDILASWSPEMVAQWMLNAGIELQVCERFIENDITGSILITLKFEDLKELGIPSFGVRTNVWNQINAMKNVTAAEPRPDTPIEDEPDREVRRELRREESVNHGTNQNKPMRRCASSRRKKPARTSPGLPGSGDDTITPMESVSIVGIEQMMPKPHQCSKGENCSKWRRNQRMMEAFKKDHPFVDMDKGGVIMVAGDPGNPVTARAIIPNDEVFRPVSDAMPSVVASSDVMGPGIIEAPLALEEGSLRAIQSRDPQDNVRQFLDFQHQHVTSSEVPPTPPFELFPSRAQQPHEGLRTLPKLAIPSQLRQTHTVPDNQAFLQFQQQQQQLQQQQQQRLSSGSETGVVPAVVPSSYPLSAETASAAPTSTTSYTNTAIEESPGRTPTAPYRFGTPFSEVDVPVTAVPLGPVARDASQSVPPDMNYRAPLTRTMSRASARRPSFPVLPSLAENQVTAAPRVAPAGLPRAASAMGHRPTYRSVSPEGLGNDSGIAGSRMQPPPRVKYPWSPERATFEKAIAPLSLITTTLNNSSSSSLASASTGTPGSTMSGASTALTSAGSSMHSATAPGGISYQGEVKKRKTKMLRHEWNDRYVTLKGTRMAVHKDKASMNHSTLEYIDIDDYAIACSTMAASTSKLNAAFKAMNIRRGSADNAGSGSSKNDVAAFAFQLIPQDAKGGVRLRKRDSAMPGSGGNSIMTSSLASTLSSGAGSLAASSLSSATPPPPPDAVNGTGKTHHFAVKSRDDRIEWMRELMLAKAMRQKGEGFEVSVNGNMI